MLVESIQLCGQLPRDFDMLGKAVVTRNKQKVTQEKWRKHHPTLSIEYTYQKLVSDSNPDAKADLIHFRTMKKIGFFTKLMSKITTFFLKLLCFNLVKKPWFLDMEINRDGTRKQTQEIGIDLHKTNHFLINSHVPTNTHFYQYDEAGEYCFIVKMFENVSRMSIERVDLTEEQWIASLNQRIPVSPHE